MLTAKDQLAHIVASTTEHEARCFLDLVGEVEEEVDLAQAAAELLKVAARLLYQDGRPECIKGGEDIDTILTALLPFITAK